MSDLSDLVNGILAKIPVFSWEDKYFYSLVDACIVLDICTLEVQGALHSITYFMRIEDSSKRLITINVLDTDGVFFCMMNFDSQVTREIQRLVKEGTDEKPLWMQIGGLN